MDTMNSKEIFQRFQDLLTEFLETDKVLLEIDSNERSISHKLAEHMQSKFTGWNVDCEYNRVKYKLKKVNGKKVNGKLVNPDIIVHHRNTYENLLVVEVKKSRNKKGIQNDRKRLENFLKAPLIYKAGILIVFKGTNATLEKFVYCPEG